MRLSRSTVRGLAWAAVAGQVLFIAAWIVAGALDRGYSHLEEGVSALGADNAAHPLIVNAAVVVLGLSIVGLGVAVYRVLPRRPAATVTALLFAGAGLAIALGGVFPVDCSFAAQSCEDAWRAGELSWQTDTHIWAGLAGQTLFALTPFALARALWPSPVAAAALLAGVFSLVFATGAAFLEPADSMPGGLIQRIGLGVLHLWVFIVAAGVLHSTRRDPPPGKLVPLRPRDFFATAWEGTGELVLRPFFLGRFFAQRFSATRRSVWLGETVFRLEDEAGFGDGRSERRQTYCEFVSDDHVRLTAGDLPDGADVWLEEDGYRMTPCRMAFPLGPVPVLIRVHDLSHVDPDGTLVNTFDARDLVFGVPLARLTFRVRPVAAGSEPAGKPEARQQREVHGRQRAHHP